MRVRTVYLAGGINGLSDADANDWRTTVKDMLPREIGVLDPMSRDYRGREDENAQVIVDGDLADIKQCEAIIAYCPRPSWGTAMEIHWSSQHRRITCEVGGSDYEPSTTVTLGYRRTVAVVPEGTSVSPWLRHHTDAVVATLEEAVAVVVGWSEAA